MYLFELLVKYLKKDRVLEILDEHDKQNAINPLEEIPELDDSRNCEHIFMPVDSSGAILACSKCGLVVNKKDLRYKNFFMNKEL
ncbi:hypothetical protein IAC76_04140 [Spirochaetes bacterium]|uniref:Uncharacterized protein n=1 Tax=Candidatus Scatousia excrementipullorum TaxID=2840936 RepID=A0A9D9DQX8_9BACT|nr:hypothetical protein [Candidatus Scatousia excrementipullorum]